MSKLLCALTVLALCGVGLADPPVVFYDDFEDNDVSDWNIGPLISDVGSHWYDPSYPDVHDGQIWGKGSGYSNPLYTWMVKPVEFNAEGGLALEVVGHSGTSWPNQANVYLFASTWPREGYVYTGGGQFNGEIVDADHEGYSFLLYGESNQRVVLTKHYYVGDTRTSEVLFNWNHNVVADQTYRLERDDLGNWSLSYGNADGSNMLPAPIGSVSDSTFNDFGHVGVDMFRNQSALDYIEVGAVPEPATLSLLGLGGLAMLRRRKK